MNAWTAAALVLLAGAAPLCLWGAAHGREVRRLAAVSLLSTVVGAVFLVLPQGYGRSSYQDLALVLAVLAPAGTLVFTRFVAGRPHDAGTDAHASSGRDADAGSRVGPDDGQGGADLSPGNG
ncbi:MrpF/PhaF family protein [Streptomyces sp. V4-01]|uniref:MrpF/PhaF family protein n=1 Tax=Actinacidiphila polyblastidii TaxID=3110430 RepID=A0ABU7PM47_9ACTN|nr:MrpF/PhaF family protein [Streptomyces sp. V4-01]